MHWVQKANQYVMSIFHSFTRTYLVVLANTEYSHLSCRNYLDLQHTEHAPRETVEVGLGMSTQNADSSRSSVIGNDGEESE